LTSGAFTIDPSTPTLRINLNEHPILFVGPLTLLKLSAAKDTTLQICSERLGGYTGRPGSHTKM
jgi:hypothetical protein